MMRYSVQFIFGKASSEALLEMQRYVAIHSPEEFYPPQALPYLSLFLCDISEPDVVSIFQPGPASQEDLHFTSGLTDDKFFKLEKKQDLALREEKVSAFFTRLWQERIKTAYIGNEPMHVCIYLPLFDEDACDKAVLFASFAKKELGSKIDLDLVCFSYDLAHLFHNDKPVNELRDIVRKQLKGITDKNQADSRLFRHVIILCNETNQRALNFTLSSLSSVLSEFAMLCVGNYQGTFGRSLETKDIQAVGLSLLQFDHYFFLEYLLQDAFLSILEKEKVLDNEVLLTECSNEIDGLLSGWVHLMSDFFRDEIQARINIGESIGKIIPTILPKLSDKFTALNTCITEYIVNNERWSFPQKKALLSTLLGQDDELFLHGTLINAEQKILIDLEREYVNFFVEQNNLLLLREETRDETILPAFQLDDPAETKAYNPIDELKDIRFKQRNYISNIRQVEDELEALKKNLQEIEESSKCLIEGGKVIFNQREYKLLPQIDDVPLSEDYTPHKVDIKSVDLSSSFTEIKNQGPQGACLSFSLVSIFEYFLKQNNIQSPDLSEQFLYYIARDKAGATDKDAGSGISCSAQALTEIGICTEEKWPYDVGKYAVRPSEEAYEDAAERKVKKMVNVSRSIEDIKSALCDGYPVVGSFVLFNSFGGGNKGVIPLPTQEEVDALKTETCNRHHAMVICGFDDQQQVFKVRNSWGKDFGDNGYCYIPYGYLQIPEAVNWFGAILEIALAKVTVVNEVQKIKENIFTIKKENREQLHFNERDIAIKFELRKVFLETLKRKLDAITNRDIALQHYYEELRLPLRDNNRTASLLSSAKTRLNLEIADLNQDISELKRSYNIKIVGHKRRTIRFMVIVCSILVVSAVVWYLVNYTPAFLASLGALALFSTIFLAIRISKRKDLEHELHKKVRAINVEVKEIEEKLELIDSRMILAGEMASHLFKLSSSLTSMHAGVKHLLLNLLEWKSKTELEHMEEKSSCEEPFIPLLDKETLCKFYESIKDDLIKDIKLWSFIEGYKPSEQGIVDVQKSIKNSILSILRDRISDFSVQDYLIRMNGTEYPYLLHSFKEISELLSILDNKSAVFAKTELTDGAVSPHVAIFLWIDSEDSEKKISLAIQDAVPAANVYRISSKYKIIEFRIV